MAPLEGALAAEALAFARVVPQARANYERRAAFRATPHGLWAGVGVGQLGDETRAATGAMRAEVTVAYERLWRLGRERLDAATARLRVAPSLVRDETTALWLAFDDEGETVQRAADVDEVLARVLEGAREWIAWPALARRGRASTTSSWRCSSTTACSFTMACRRSWARAPARARRRASRRTRCSCTKAR